MPDREKVVTALECLADGQTCACCDYKPYYDCAKRVARDAIALLKEHEKAKVVFGRTKDGEFVTECGNCGTYLAKAYSNCPKCKKELDWNSNQI